MGLLAWWKRPQRSQNGKVNAWRREMLDALERLVAVSADLAGGRLPRVDTTHRVVGGDECHFSAPVSLPEDPSQPTGRLLLTSTRAVFAGGVHPITLPWYAAAEIAHVDRDV